MDFDNVGNLLHFQRNDGFRAEFQEFRLFIDDRLRHPFQGIVTLFNAFDQPFGGIDLILNVFPGFLVGPVAENLLISLADPQPGRVFVQNANHPFVIPVLLDEDVGRHRLCRSGFKAASRKRIHVL